MRFEDYLIKSINQMEDLLMKAEAFPGQAPDCLLAAAVLGCRTLKELTGDVNLNSVTEEFADVRIIKGFLDRASSEYKRRQAKIDEFRSVIEESDRFDDFLDLEREILIKGGLHRDTVEALIEASRESITEVRERAKPPSEVLEAARLLRDRACVLASDLIEEARQQDRWEDIKERIRKVILGLGGAALIGLNASSLAASVGITAALSVVSVGIGGAVVQSAAADIAKSRGAAQ